MFYNLFNIGYQFIIANICCTYKIIPLYIGALVLWCFGALKSLIKALFNALKYTRNVLPTNSYCGISAHIDVHSLHVFCITCQFEHFQRHIFTLDIHHAMILYIQYFDFLTSKCLRFY